MLEYRAIWTGARVGTGYSVFHMDGGAPQPKQDIADEIRLWFSARAAALPNDITVNFDSEVKELSLAGNLLDVHPVTPPTAVAGSNSANWSAASGRVVRWNTSTVNNGKRLIGHTFLVPSVEVYGNDGNVLPATIAADAPVHAALISGLSSNGTPLVVWSRRYAATGDVVTGTTLARPVSLRTRND